MYGVESLPLVVQQIEFARNYTLTLVDDLEPELYFVRPDGCPAHLGWQIGHLTMAQYMLTLFRGRGKNREDEAVIPKSFLRLFLKGTTPGASTDYPSPAELRSTFDAVNRMVQTELPSLTAEQLSQTVTMPYAVCNNVLGSLIFCASHEMLHAGQIGLLRRLLGKPPVR